MKLTLSVLLTTVNQKALTITWNTQMISVHSIELALIFCGTCQRNLSQVFGMSRCRECSSMWMLLWVPTFALAGIALVVTLIFLNITVPVGTINGLVFYANIVRANQATFFPPNKNQSIPQLVHSAPFDR